ncbi:MAG: rRNA maturation RNase YbeY [Lachnospiraceae bacterium]|nr:rRNA maturation RNase YbeY [Lachnospiraceae bacterium]
MSIIFETEVELNELQDFDVPAEIERVVNACVDYLKCEYEVQVNVLITDNDAIHQMNLENRGIDRPTDVLSFPMIEWETPGKCNFSEEDEILLCDPDSGELMLGDIVISLDKVLEQSSEYGHSRKRELLFLIAHSMLHLFGFDHEDESEREEMERMQKEILDSVGVTR